MDPRWIRDGSASKTVMDPMDPLGFTCDGTADWNGSACKTVMGPMDPLGFAYDNHADWAWPASKTVMDPMGPLRFAYDNHADWTWCLVSRTGGNGRLQRGWRRTDAPTLNRLAGGRTAGAHAAWMDQHKPPFGAGDPHPPLES